MRGLPDGDLMNLYAQGSEAAFDELFRRYERRAYGYFLRRVGCEARARDLYQELFLRLHRSRSTYDPERDFEPWFFHIARSVLIDDWRRRQRGCEVTLDEATIPSQDADAEWVAAAREKVEHALHALSVENARILVGTKVLGLNYGEVAASLSRSVDAVKQASSRSLRRLRAAPSLDD